MLTDGYGLSLVHHLVRRAGRLRSGLQGKAHHVSRCDRGIRSCHRQRTPALPSPTSPARTRCWNAATLWRRAKSIAAAKTLAAGLPAREASHVAYFGLLVAGDAEAALAALPAHLNAWPRDVLVLGTTAFTNGLIGSSGRQARSARCSRCWTGSPRTTATTIGGSPPITAWRCRRTASTPPPVRRSSGRWRRTRPIHGRRTPGSSLPTRRAIRTRPRLPGIVADQLSARRLALQPSELASRARPPRGRRCGGGVPLFSDAFAPDVHSGPPRGKLNDAVSFLWRWELAGHPRDTEAWRAMQDFVDSAFPRAGAAFSDLHIAVAHAVAGDGTALEERAQQIDALARAGRYPSGHLVPAVSRGFAAFEQHDFAAAIDALEPIADELERIGGSHAQLDLVRFTLLKAYLGADRPDDARRMLNVRRPRAPVAPVAGLAVVTDRIALST